MTTRPNALLARVHKRLPATLDPEQRSLWVDTTLGDPGELLGLLRLLPTGDLVAFAVGPGVNSVWHDGPARGPDRAAACLTRVRTLRHDAGIVVGLTERRYRDQMPTRWPSTDEYGTGARLAAANARRLSRAARRLERSGDFGAATALFATALEEAVKAGVLVLLEEESEAVAGDHEEILRLVFSDHKTKYRLAAWAIGTSEQSSSAAIASGEPGELLAVLGLLVVFVVLIDQVRRGEKLPESAPPVDLATAPFLTHLASELPEGSQTWAAKALAVRNRGLYVGFVGGHWEHPGTVTRQDADEARGAVVPMVRAVSRWARAGKALV